MKALKKILISLLIVVVLLVVVSFFLPSKYSVERTITINSSMDQVVAQINNFKNWSNWSPWEERDTTMEKTYEGDINSDSYTMSWVGDEDLSGEGSMTREEVNMEDGAASLKYKLAFTKPFESESKNTFKFEKTGEGTKVTWTDEGELGMNPIMKYMGLFFDGMIGPDFEKGLANLKAYVEDPANAPKEETGTMQINGYDAQLIDIEGFTVLGIRKTMPTSEIEDAEVFAYNLGKLFEYTQANSIEPTGAPMAIYNSYDPEGDVDVTFAVPVAAGTTVAEGSDVVIVEVPANKALEVTYVGAYDENMKNTWMAIDPWVADNGMQNAWAPWEHYIDDPQEVGMENTRTKIVVPVMEAAAEGETAEATEE